MEQRIENWVEPAERKDLLSVDQEIEELT